MKQLIDKSAVVAEIRRIMAEEMSFFEDCCKDEFENSSSPVVYTRMEMLLSFLDTLEVKEVEEETISEDLEYAALLHYPKMSRISEPHGFIPADNKSHYLGDANEDNRKAFIVGAQWQKERNAIEVKEVDEEYNGKAMLHVLEKGVKQGKRELIDRACEWLRDNLHHYWGSISADPHNFLFDFRKAMEE